MYPKPPQHGLRRCHIAQIALPRPFADRQARTITKGPGRRQPLPCGAPFRAVPAPCPDPLQPQGNT